jgi:hypothetical protein
VEHWEHSPFSAGRTFTTCVKILKKCHPEPAR